MKNYYYYYVLKESWLSWKKNKLFVMVEAEEESENQKTTAQLKNCVDAITQCLEH